MNLLYHPGPVDGSPKANFKLNILVITGALAASAIPAVAQVAPDCRQEAKALLKKLDNSIPGPYLWDVAAADSLSWIQEHGDVAQNSEATTLGQRTSFATARNRYISCTLQATADTAQDAQKVYDRVKAKSAQYQSLALQGVRTLRPQETKPPALLDVVLDSAARDAQRSIEPAVRAIAGKALANAWLSKRLTPDLVGVQADLDEAVTALNYSEPVSTFIRNSVSDLINTKLRANGFSLGSAKTQEAFVRAFLQVNPGSSLLQTAKEYAATQIQALAPVSELEGKKLATLARFVADSRKATLTYAESIGRAATAMGSTSAQLRQFPSQAFTGELQGQLGDVTNPAKMLVALKTVRSDVQNQVRALSPAALADLKFREDAAQVSQDFSETATTLRSLQTVISELQPEAGRYVAAASVAADTVSQVAGLMAQGAMGPVGWVSIGLSVMQAGGSIGAMFGGRGGPDPAQVALRKALADISVQLHELRGLVQSQHEEVKALLFEQFVLSGYLVRAEAENMFRSYESCSSFVNYLHKMGSNSPVELVTRLRSELDSDPLTQIARCVKFLDDFVAVSTLGESSPRLTFFLTQDAIDLPKAAARAARDGKSDDFNKYLWSSILNRKVLEAQKRLVDGAAKRFNIPPTKLWLSHTRPAITWRDVALRQENSTKSEQLIDAADTLSKMFERYGVKTIASDVTFSELLAEPLAIAPLLRILLASSRITDIAELLVRGQDDSLSILTPDSLNSAQASDLNSRRVKATQRTPNVVPAALSGLAWATLNRGDYLVPYVSELLKFDDEPWRCQSLAAGEADPLCKLELQSLRRDVMHAKFLVRELPDFRANVAAWRVREQLLATDGPERADGSRDSTRYSDAMSSSSEFKLRAMLPGLPYFWMAPTSAKTGVPPADVPYPGKGHWYTRLSGKCAGFQSMDIALNAMTRCDGSQCTGAAIVEGVPKSQLAAPENLSDDNVRAYIADRADLCVVAPIPSPERVADGRPRAESSVQTLMNASRDFLEQTLYYRRLGGAKDSAPMPLSGLEAVEFATFAKPPSVGLWMYGPQWPDSKSGKTQQP